jgi:chemotaxis methyl-accepting protein methylase
VIFCRNVMIYFDKPTQGKILNRFAPMMKDDGLLFAGHSENFLYVCPMRSSCAAKPCMNWTLTRNPARACRAEHEADIYE